MPVNTRHRVASYAIKTLTSAVACAVLLSPAAHAAGLGKLTVLSALGQPLRAEIELTAVSAQEAGALVAKLAPVEAFRQANIEFNPALLSLNFSIEQRAGRQFIRVTSAQAVNEPFVDMLLELTSSSGRLVREYTFLLDPADMRQPQPAQVAAPAQSAPSAPLNEAPLPRQTPPAQAAAPTPPPRASSTPTPTPVPTKSAVADYRVKRGDTLTRIASQLKPADVSLDVMLVALYRANPEAFSGKNMNRLQSGRILAVPDSGDLRGGEGEAHGVVVAHAADFAAYRNKLAAQVAQSTPSKAPQESQSAAGKITAKVEERATPANESKDQLKLSKAAPNAATAGKTAVAGVEDKIAKEKQVAEASARVKELEKNVNDLQDLMAVKNKSLADQSKAAAAASAVAGKPAPAAASLPPEAMEAPKPKPKPVPLVKKAPSPLAEPSLMDSIMANISNIGLVLAALLLAAFLLLRRKKQPPKAEPIVSEPDLTDPLAPVPAAFAEADNNVFESGLAPTTSQIDTNEVDPVAEADVYIAYGRDAQAEEILLEALRNNPERHAARLKLLEIYSTRKSLRPFEDQASELYSLTRGQGDEWRQAAALGLALDPLNPLYANTDANAGANIDANSDVDTVVHLGKGPGVGAEPTIGELAAHDNLERALLLDAARAGNSMDFDGALERDSEMITAAPAPVSADALDFDLGNLDFEPVSVADKPVSMTKAAPEPEFDNSMDFGLDLEPRTGANAGSPAIAAAPTPDPLMDLDLMDFDLPEPSLATAKPAAAPVPESIDDLFAKAATPAKPAASAAPVLDPDATAVPEFDLSGIDLDLGDEAPKTATANAPVAAPAAATAAASAAAASAAGRSDPLSAIHMEMDTKLDLAIAYQEIGDKEGARELIDEVIKGGSDDQVAKANTMRALLG